MLPTRRGWHPAGHPPNSRLRGATPVALPRAVTSADFAERAKRYFKANLKRAGVEYKELAERLTKMGLPESGGSITVKINRGLSSMVYDRRFGCLILGQHEQCWSADQRNQHQENATHELTVPRAPNAEATNKTEEPCYPGSEPKVSCDGIAAKAAVDQASDANKQAALINWQFGVGVGTLFAAIAAAIYAGIAVHHTKRSVNGSNGH